MTASMHHQIRPSLLDDGRKLAALAAAVFLISMFFPWYEKSVLIQGAAGAAQRPGFTNQGMSAFGAFTWVEAALLLVDAAVLLLLWLRTTGRRVELPADDGTMIAIAGGWMVVLLIVRVFDKPTVPGVGSTVGLQWGLLLAMAAAGGMLASGLASRAIERTAKHGGGPGDETPSGRRGSARAERNDASTRGASTARVGPTTADGRSGSSTRGPGADEHPVAPTATSVRAARTSSELGGEERDGEVPPRWRRPRG
ncbi:MAG: hypothetical protein PGN13_09235 [Patulibacter minatonensis]